MGTGDGGHDGFHSWYQLALWKTTVTSFLGREAETTICWVFAWDRLCSKCSLGVTLLHSLKLHEAAINP